MEARVKTLSDYLETLRRRKWSLILPAVIIFAVAAVVALALPPVYKSTATILIEQQEIPSEFVMATVTTYAEQRLETIKQRIMSSTRLLEVINRFDLYSKLRDRRTTEEIVEEMREDIELETISAEVLDRRTGRSTAATIAFTLSFEGKNPNTVQQVANVLASLYLEENLKAREQQALGASRFLEEEGKAMKIRLVELEAKIAAFKEKNINELPELLQVNLQGLDRVEQDVERMNDQIRSLKEREQYLHTQLASIPPDESGDKKRLDDLKLQLIHLQTRFSDEYPDVVKTKAEIAELEKRDKSTGSTEDSSGPVVIGAAAADSPDNPAYVTLASQLASTQSEIHSMKRQIRELQKRRDEYRSRIEATPRVEETYKALLIERDNTQAKYNDLMRKFMEARVAHGLEKEQKGERFTLIDPPRYPEKPHKPNRPAILLIGFVLSIGGAVGIAALREHSDRSVRSADMLVRATSFPVLATIPEIVTAGDTARRKVVRIGLAAGVVLTIVVAILAFHFFVMDLDIFWAKLSRRMAL